MKKNLLTLAVAGAVSASAQAQMYLNSDNTGEVLIYPFYSADNGNQTYIHVVNTTGIAKAAKVRILEAENSNEVRDFNLYLSPYDHFSFSITLNSDGGGVLKTADTSCTVPAIPEGGIGFTNELFKNDTNASLERTLNGYVEIIEMGQFEHTATTSPGYLWDHNGTGVPRSCAGVVKLWTAGTAGKWYNELDANSKRGVFGQLSDWTGGGLYGMGIIVNVEAGAAVGYDAVAIENFVDDDDNRSTVDGGPAKGAALHFYPGNPLPGLEGNEFTDNVASIYDGGVATNHIFNKGADGVTATLNAVSGLLMVDTVSNDYVLDPFFDGKTDWVVTFPTKRLYVAKDSDTTDKARAQAPFYEEWDGKDSCDPYRIQLWDREETTYNPQPNDPPFSPYTAVPDEDPFICYEANVLTFAKEGEDHKSPLLGAEPSVSGGRIQVEIDSKYDNGWAKIDFNQSSLAATYAAPAFHQLASTTATLYGLPTVGFSVIRFGNDSVQGGVLANYAAAHEHKTTRNIS